MEKPENQPTIPNETLNLLKSGNLGELCDLSDDHADELYQLTKDSDRVQGMMNAKGRKNLDAEEAMLRVLLEIRWNQQDHEANGGRGLSDVISAVKDMVVANANLAHKRGAVLDESQVTDLAKGLLEIVTEAGRQFVTEKRQTDYHDYVSAGVLNLIQKAIK